MWLNDNCVAIVPDEAKEDKEGDHDDGDNNTPDQKLVSCSRASHCLMQLLVSILNVLGRSTKFFINNFKLGTLELSLIFDVFSDTVDILHQSGHKVD